MEAAKEMHDDGLLEQARELVQQLEAGNRSEAGKLIKEMGSAREQSLFCELGKMTRQLHDALNGFDLEKRMHSLAEAEIPDARLRLNHVIDMTEEAANRTLTVVEETMPVVEQLRQQASGLDEKWECLRNRDMQVEEFRDMSREMEQFLGTVSSHADRIHSSLSDVMMAQDFQDLTGQIIRRVIILVQEVEENLVDLIRLGGGAGERESTSRSVAASEKKEDLMQGTGPQIPGARQGAASVAGQDEVDDLLSSLGF